MRRVFSAAIALALLFGPHIEAQSPRRPPSKPATKAPAKKATAPLPEPPPPPPPPPPDVTVSARYTSGATVTRSTIVLHGARQRIDYESDLAAIQQCDAGRVVQVNTKTRTYLEMPFAPVAAPASDLPAAKTRGGTIVYTTVITDTTERKELFGFQARRLRTVISKDASAEACDKKPEKVEIDGWYIDLPSTVTCAAAPAPTSEVRVDPKDATCRDRVTFVRAAAQTPFPTAYSMTATTGSDPGVTTTMEVTELARTSADPRQFEVADDYVPVKSVAQLTADHRPGEDGPKKPGVLRVGVAPVANRSDQQLSTADLAQALVESLGEVEPDVVLLHGDTAAAIEADAKARSCDYVLQNTIAEVKKPGKSMLGKLAGTSADAYSAKIEFALATPGEAKPAFSGSGRSGTSMLQTAVGAAKRVSQYFPPFMMARYGYLNAFTTMSGAASPGAMQQTQDPVLSTVFALVDRATAPKRQETLTSGEGAVAAAMEREVEAVVAQLSRKKS